MTEGTPSPTRHITDELNVHPSKIPHGKHDELRALYAGNGLAQLVIDGFDGQSELFSMIQDHKNAVRDGEDEKAADLNEKIDDFKQEKYEIESNRE